jgi:mgtE-like transporter
MAFAPRRRVRSIWRYFRAERRTLRQGTVALLLGTVAAFVAGIALGSISHTLETLPGLIILIPAAVGMRGVIFGAMGARLGTSTHAGLFEVTRERTGVLYQNVFAAVVLTAGVSVYLALLAKGSATAFHLPSISVPDLITISFGGAVVSSAVILGFTIGLSVRSYQKGYDLDAVGTPLITASGDMVTVPALYLATFLTHVRWLSLTVAVLSVALAVVAVVQGVLTDLPLARRILVESVPMILIAPVLDILAGTFLEAHLPRFVLYPGLLVLIPPLVSNAGALGGILSSRLTSKLQLGVISPRGRPEPAALLDAALVIGFAIVVFTAVGAAGLGFSVVAGTAHPGAGVMVGGTLLTGLIATVVAVMLAYYVAILTVRFGFDPDNTGVPLITSSMDLAGVISFLLVLSFLGVAS